MSVFEQNPSRQSLLIRYTSMEQSHISLTASKKLLQHTKLGDCLALLNHLSLNIVAPPKPQGTIKLSTSSSVGVALRVSSFWAKMEISDISATSRLVCSCSCSLVVARIQQQRLCCCYGIMMHQAAPKYILFHPFHKTQQITFLSFLFFSGIGHIQYSECACE